MKTSVVGRTWQKMWLGAGLLVLLAGQLDAATFWVTNTLDSGLGSLRQAISNANAVGGGTIAFTNTAGTITLASPLADLAGTLSIVGPGTNLLSVSGSNAMRVFSISSSATVSISGLTIANGFTNNSDGGGILNAGSLAVANCLFVNNGCGQGMGGAIMNQGPLTIRSSVFASNGNRPWMADSAAMGGALYSQTGSVLVTNSTFVGNGAYGWQTMGISTPAYGGAIYVQAGNFTMAGSTLYGNVAQGPHEVSLPIFSLPTDDGYGGGIANKDGTVQLVNSTISQNSAIGGSAACSESGKWPSVAANGYGGGVANVGTGSVSLINCTVYQNNAVGGQGIVCIGGTSPNGYGSGVGLYRYSGGATSLNTILQSSASSYSPLLISQGGNMFEYASGINTQPSDQTNVAITLAPLQNYGGPTLTHTLLPGSPAIDAGISTGAPAFDQRGVARPQNARVDIGGVEWLGGAPVATTNPPAQQFIVGGTASLSIWLEGAQPLFFQWSKDGVDIGGGTNATLAVAPVTDWHEGQYRLVISNAFGVARSGVIQVTLLYPIQTKVAGGGSISRSPSLPAYSRGQSVTLAAVTNAGWQFMQWLGDLSGTNLSASLVMTRPRYVQAVFGTLVSTSVQAGSGSVLVDPAVPLIPHGAKVRFTAVPQPGNYFARWANAKTNNPLVVVVTNASAAGWAYFYALSNGQYALTVIPDGRGQVTASPAGNRFTNGQNVTLTAYPEAGQSFLGWSGDASGTQTNLVVVMNQSRIITANFSKPRPQMSMAPTLAGSSAGDFRFAVTGDVGQRYDLQASSNLTQWTSLGLVTNLVGAIPWVEPSMTNRLARSYRALVVP